MHNDHRAPRERPTARLPRDHADKTSRGGDSPPRNDSSAPRSSFAWLFDNPETWKTVTSFVLAGVFVGAAVVATGEGFYPITGAGRILVVVLAGLAGLLNPFDKRS